MCWRRKLQCTIAVAGYRPRRIDCPPRVQARRYQARPELRWAARWCSADWPGRFGRRP